HRLSCCWTEIGSTPFASFFFFFFFLSLIRFSFYLSLFVSERGWWFLRW
ncbi:unnamed protein product, partial [Linum tenue]